MFKLNKQVVYRGRAYQIPVCYLDLLQDQISISGLTEHYLRVENEDGTWIEKQCQLGFAWGVLPDEQTYIGVYSFTAEESAAFKLGSYQSVFLKLVYSGNIMWQEMKNFIHVFPDAF